MRNSGLNSKISLNTQMSNSRSLMRIPSQSKAQFLPTISLPISIRTTVTTLNLEILSNSMESTKPFLISRIVSPSKKSVIYMKVKDIAGNIIQRKKRNSKLTQPNLWDLIQNFSLKKMLQPSHVVSSPRVSSTTNSNSSSKIARPKTIPLRNLLQ